MDSYRPIKFNPRQAASVKRCTFLRGFECTIYNVRSIRMGLVCCLEDLYFLESPLFRGFTVQLQVSVVNTGHKMPEALLT